MLPSIITVATNNGLAMIFAEVKNETVGWGLNLRGRVLLKSIMNDFFFGFFFIGCRKSWRCWSRGFLGWHSAISPTSLAQVPQFKSAWSFIWTQNVPTLTWTWWTLKGHCHAKMTKLCFENTLFSCYIAKYHHMTWIHVIYSGYI